MTMVITPFRQRALSDFINKQKPVPTFLRQTLLSGDRYVSARVVDLATMYDARRLGAFVQRKGEAALIEAPQKRVQSMAIPRISNYTAIHFGDITDLARNAFGTNENVQEAFDELTTMHMTTLRSRAERALEWLLGRFISTGSATVAAQTYTIGTIGSFTPSGAWSTSTTDVVADIAAMRRAVLQTSPNDVTRVVGIYNSSVGRHILNSQSYQRYFASAFVGQRTVSQQLFPNVTFHGNVEGVDLYQYDEVYVQSSDPDTTVTPIIPNNTFVVVAVSSANREYYTHAENADGLNSREKFYAKQWMQYNRGVEMIYNLVEVNALPFVDADSVVVAAIS